MINFLRYTILIVLVGLTFSIGYYMDSSQKSMLHLEHISKEMIMYKLPYHYEKIKKVASTLPPSLQDEYIQTQLLDGGIAFFLLSTCDDDTVLTTQMISDADDSTKGITFRNFTKLKEELLIMHGL